MPVRILHIVTYMGRGGLETLIMNCYRHIDREQVQFDFLVHRDFRADYDDEIEALGGKIYRLPRLNPFSPGYFKALHSFFRSHPEYKIVHCHLDCLSAIPLSAAKKCGIPVRIAHAHSTSQDQDWKYPLKLFFKKLIPSSATHFFACSQAAGNWMFHNQPVTVINNGIDTNLFRFHPDVRNEVRKELGISTQLVLGHTGRFMYPKNHSFLIDIFNEVHKRNPSSSLLLVGAGPMEDQIRSKCDSLGLTDCVHFLGLRTDVERILQAMDIFVMPSIYEGLGIAAVEAQATGLPCFLSDTIPQECAMTDAVYYLPLSLPAPDWAEHILATDTRNRRSSHESVRDAGFDIQTTADYLQSFYLKNW